MMKVYAVTMMRDEADVAYHVLLHMAGESVDGIIVADNNSRDRTRELMLDAKNEIIKSRPDFDFVVRDDPEIGYYQAIKMTKMALEAKSRGAEWIIPFDADELWCSDSLPVGEFLRNVPTGVNQVQASLFNHFRSSQDDETAVNPFQRMIYREAFPASLPKIAFRCLPGFEIMQGNHVVRFDGKIHAISGLQVRHFPYRSQEHFVLKARNGKEAYDATDLPEGTGAHWRMYGEALEKNGPEALYEHYKTHFFYSEPESKGLVRDPAPFRRWST